jgi:5-methyltetrahydrofolate corrinoid/iron sulfur protein methyltransferase
MQQTSFKEEIRRGSKFLVLAELTGGPGFSLRPMEAFLEAYQKAGAAALPKDFAFVGITLPQSPGGVANIEPTNAIADLQAKKLLDGLDLVPHVTCKDMNGDAIVSSLMTLKKMGVASVLALTGDKPVKTQRVFELESVGLLNLIRRINHEAYIGAQPQSLGAAHQFFAGAAVSPFKYSEAAQMQQYYKMEKKIRSGAQFLITQVGWDWRKSAELFTYLKQQQLNVPVIGNVYVLTTLTPAPRLMHDIKLPGCFVSDDLLAKVLSESVDDHVERAAQQVAMYKNLGAAGVDIGGVQSFEMFAKILQRAAQIGTKWEPFKDNLCWPAQKPFYLYDELGKMVTLSTPAPTMGKRFFNIAHWAMLDPKFPGFHVFRELLRVTGVNQGKGPVYKLFNSCEKAYKYLQFDCQECGDCFLPENFGLCTMGGCEKGLDNAPCGDATVDGRCGNNLDRTCIGDRIYAAAASEGPRGIERLKRTINKPRNPALQHTSSLVNYLFAKDHTMKNALISIGEAIHASIPKTGQIMKQLRELGPEAYAKDSPQLAYIRSLIESQAAEGADYLAVNLDAFGEDNPQTAVDMMVEYTRLVKKWGNGVPICFDSSNDDVLIAGLKEWYKGDSEVRTPLMNSIKVYTMDRMMPLKADYDFSFIGLLMSEDKPTGPGGSHSVEELFGLASQLFDKAMEHGFKPSQIFFDSTVFPLAIDMPMEPGVPGYTYRAFETIKRIKSESRFEGVHCSLGISNSVRDLPGRRIGVCRAYVAKAMEYGLDAGIVNISHHYGTVPADAELLELVDAYAKMDGSMEKMTRAMDLMAKFCQGNRKPV